MLRVSKHCEVCDTKDVVKDANAEWDEDTQIWVLRSFYDQGYCCVCETEVNIIERDLIENKASIIQILPTTDLSRLDEIIAEQDAYYGKTTPEVEEEGQASLSSTSHGEHTGSD